MSTIVSLRRSKRLAGQKRNYRETLPRNRRSRAALKRRRIPPPSTVSSIPSSRAIDPLTDPSYYSSSRPRMIGIFSILAQLLPHVPRELASLIVAYDYSGSRLFTTSTHGAHVWDMDSGIVRALPIVNPESATDICTFGPGNRFLMVITDGGEHDAGQILEAVDVSRTPHELSSMSARSPSDWPRVGDYQRISSYDGSIRWHSALTASGRMLVCLCYEDHKDNSLRYGDLFYIELDACGPSYRYLLEPSSRIDIRRTNDTNCSTVQEPKRDHQRLASLITNLLHWRTSRPRTMRPDLNGPQQERFERLATSASQSCDAAVHILSYRQSHPLEDSSMDPNAVPIVDPCSTMRTLELNTPIDTLLTFPIDASDRLGPAPSHIPPWVVTSIQRASVVLLTLDNGPRPYRYAAVDLGTGYVLGVIQTPRFSAHTVWMNGPLSVSNDDGHRSLLLLT